MTDSISTDLFVKVPHWVMDYLVSADLNMTQFRIINAVIRYTFGYNQRECWMSLPFLSELIKCNERQVRRELKVMIENGIVLDRREGKKRYLRINPKMPVSLDRGTPDSLDLYLPDSLDLHIKKRTKEKSNKEKYYIDFNEIDDIPFLKIYNQVYKKTLGTDHPRITDEQYQALIEWANDVLSYYITETEFLEAAQEHFANLPKSNDGKIFAFTKSWRRHFGI